MYKAQLERIQEKLNKLQALDPERNLFGAENHQYEMSRSHMWNPGIGMLTGTMTARKRTSGQRLNMSIMIRNGRCRVGWEYGIRTTKPAILPGVVKRLADALTFSEMYKLEHYEDGFVLLQEGSSWPEALQVSIEVASGMNEVAGWKPKPR
ncbi:MAG TPA: hypothetical protein DEF35_17800 [Paenibacillus sp.]|uniref:hypothetical protein n=1 Tax=Paenibacillus sp. TaxID=58172 RepID=UPI000BA08B0D|nr:hypothetical protein [Paenibacillus sp.]OZQ72656.1 hypothetical protein CA599_05910 [Paenibacillus taichungensis]HBU83476.1 hypothetical protein [Paenibacillus sp.]